MMFIPYYPADNINNNGYSEYERDTYYFNETVKALTHWHKHDMSGGRERAVIPNTSNPNRATEEVKAYFDKEYAPERPLECERFDEAAKLLEQIVKTNGVKGLYSFFSVLSSEDTGGFPEVDKMRFRKVISEVIVPHFEPAPTEEILHGAATVGHVLLAPFAGLAHTPVAAYSVMRLRQLRNKRLERREEPPLETIDHMLPLVQSMHEIGQRAIDVLNHIQPIEDRAFPDLPPINMKILETALERVRHGDDLLDQHEYHAR